MVYQVIAILLFLLALAALFFVFKLLGNKKWIAGFLRGVAGISILVVALGVVLSGKDIYGYQSVGADNNVVATVSFRKKEANTYIVELQEPSGAFSSREVQGQQWQLSVRTFDWPPLIAFVGLRTGYMLEAISARFIELQLDKMVEREQPEALSQKRSWDTWQFLNAHPAAMPLVSAHLAMTNHTPIADGAIFEVLSAGQYLTVTPVNAPAKDAVKSW